MLAMKDQCGSCTSFLAMDGTAYICSFECTYCESCTRKTDFICPSCSGELVIRPRRVQRETT